MAAFLLATCGRTAGRYYSDMNRPHLTTLVVIVGIIMLAYNYASHGKDSTKEVAGMPLIGVRHIEHRAGSLAIYDIKTSKDIYGLNDDYVEFSYKIVGAGDDERVVLSALIKCSWRGQDSYEQVASAVLPESEAPRVYLAGTVRRPSMCYLWVDVYRDDGDVMVRGIGSKSERFLIWVNL